MAAVRDLPEKRNPLVAPKHTPQLEILVERRRLGQTVLKVQPGQVGTSNATKPDNLGTFDYAHLRVPLPKDLHGSGIFNLQPNQTTYPEAYFLMRRSSDGYISATGMFKAAFPWAQVEEEEHEKRYIKSLPETGHEEIAGNVWIPAESALDLADEYGMRPWIIALLDPEPIAKGTHDPAKRIATPPRFVMKDAISANGASFPPPSESASTRRRTLRSASPSKAPPTPSRKIATPRKSRRARGTQAASSLSTAVESAEESSQVPEASVEPESVNGDAIGNPSPETPRVSKAEKTVDEDSEVVKVDIESTTEPALDGGEPVTTTHVTVETPANHPDLKLPADAQAYLEQAKAAIREANKLTAGRAAGKKRKAMEMLEDELEEVEAAAVAHGDDLAGPDAIIEQPAKKLRLTETELRKEKIKRRATLGIAASLAVGAMLPVVMGTFFSAL
ncbi:hypothetical protein MBLNU459_g1222t1 [Dothideomycetes sp. NU459]